MSHWICCNSCFLPPNNERRLAVTSCGHVVCNGCFQRSKQGQCLICNTSCQVSPLTSRSSAEVKALFTDVGVTVKKHVAEIDKVLMFQARHQKRLLTHYKKRSEKLEDVLMKMKQEIEQMTKKLNEQSAYISKLEYSLQHQSAKTSSMSFNSHMPHKSAHQIHQESPRLFSKPQSTLNMFEDMGDNRGFRNPIMASRLSISSPQLGRMGTLPHKPASQNTMANRSTRSATASHMQGAPVTPDLTFGQMSGWQSAMFKPVTPLRPSITSSLFRPPP